MTLRIAKDVMSQANALSAKRLLTFIHLSTQLDAVPLNLLGVLLGLDALPAPLLWIVLDATLPTYARFATPITFYCQSIQLAVVKFKTLGALLIQYVWLVLITITAKDVM